MKTAYLLVTDLHYNVKKEHRVNYFGEVLTVLQQVIEINDKYKQRGYETVLIFLGDVIDSSINSADDAMRCLDVLRFVSSQFRDTYTVLGNHEQHNISGNPFWFLVSSLEDESLFKLSKAIQPQSVNGSFRVPATIRDGDVTIYFNHYGTPPKVPNGDGVNIGLFHQNVGSNSICKMWGTFDNVEEAAYVRSYNYCFFGHMHLAVGKYYIGDTNTCVGEWLGSCVGTNVNEVTALKDDLNIPTILIEDGHFSCIEDNAVKRIEAERAIDYQKLELTKATQQMVAASKDLVTRDITASTLFEQVSIAAKEAGLDFLVELLLQDSYNIKRSYDNAKTQAASGIVTNEDDTEDCEEEDNE